MTNNRETIEMLKMLKEQALKSHNDTAVLEVKIDSFNFVLDEAIKALEQQPCEMTVNEYRNRLMDAFHNADCDELIAVVVKPDESEFKQLEWLLKNHYHNQKQQPCEDVISRQAAKKALEDRFMELQKRHDDTRYETNYCLNTILELPPVTPKEKTDWTPVSEGLPERHKEVIVTDIETSDTYLSRYIGNGYWECDNGLFKNRIIAWMPLPEPYKEVSE